MPRRNYQALLIIVALSLVCYLNADRHGQLLLYALDQIDQRYLEEIDRSELFEGAMQGMVSKLDTNSAYISPETVKAFEESLDQKFGGLGMQVSLDPKTKQLTVMSPLVGTPAYEAGIRAGDRILRIDDESTQGLSLRDAVERMRGKPGEPVDLSILHVGEDKPIDLTIVRDIIQVDTVLGDSRRADGDWDYFLEGHGRIGYLRINTFGEKTSEELDHALKWLEKHRMRGLILDLRNDPGGLLAAAIDVCDLFIDDGVIVTTRRRDGQIRESFTASQGNTYSGFPMAVLVNQYSASASEIVAACLQDHGRAIVVGQRSFGKGTVQEVIGLESGKGKLKLTTASYWRPSGRNIHRTSDSEDGDHWGVSPNEGYEVIVDDEDLPKLLRARLRRDIYQPGDETPEEDVPPEEDAEPFADPQLEKAVEYVEEALKEEAAARK